MSLESMEMAEDRKRYIIETLNDPLEEAVTAIIGAMPKDVIAFMLAHFEKKGVGRVGASSGDDKPAALKENEDLKAELQRLKKDKRMLAVVENQVAAPEAEKEEEEEEDDDDVIDEVEPPPPNSQKVRGSVSAAAYGAWNVKQAKFTPPVHNKSSEQKEQLKATLAKAFLFANVSGDSLDVLIGAMEAVKAKAGEELIKQGDNGDFLFVVESGALECWKAAGEDPPKLVKTCEAGDVFGELSLMYNAPRAASVKAKVECNLWKLDAETFTYIVSESAANSRNEKKAFLKKVDLLEQLDEYELGQLADALKQQEHGANVELFTQGDKGNMFYLLETGTAVAIKDGTEVMSYKSGQYFGELALLKNEERAATIKTTSAVKLQTLPRAAFNRLLGPLTDLLAQSAAKYT